MRTVGLLGTAFTMEKTFYHDRLEERGITVLVPDAEGRRRVNGVIYDELVAGVIRDASREAFLEIIEGLEVRGAEGVILGCTEIPLLVSQEASALPLFDTTTIHAEAALRYAVET